MKIKLIALLHKIIKKIKPYLKYKIINNNNFKNLNFQII